MSDITRELTFGEKRVQRNFNPSANRVIEDLKTDYAALIDKLEDAKTPRNGRETALAQTELETSCMYAVKSLFV